MPERQKYLAYGSNLHPERLREREVEVGLITTVRLEGWRLAFHKRSNDGSAKCDIIDAVEEEDHVWCALYRIEPAHAERLDGFEGVGFGYERRILRLDGHGRAFTYVASPSAISVKLQPFTWYRDIVAAGARYHGFPEAYVEVIAGVAATEDPNQARAETNKVTLSKLAADCRR